MFAGDGAGLRSGGGLGVGTAMRLLGGKSVPGLSRGLSEGGGLRSGSGSGDGGSGSDSGGGAGGGIFLKSSYFFGTQVHTPYWFYVEVIRSLKNPYP